MIHRMVTDEDGILYRSGFIEFTDEVRLTQLETRLPKCDWDKPPRSAIESICYYKGIWYFRSDDTTNKTETYVEYGTIPDECYNRCTKMM